MFYKIYCSLSYLFPNSLGDSSDRIFIFSRSKFVPGLDRTAPYTLELVVTLPPKSTTKISVDFEHSILKWNEYPPDANKGTVDHV